MILSGLSRLAPLPRQCSRPRELQASAGDSEQKDLWPIPCRRGLVFWPIAERFSVFFHLGYRAVRNSFGQAVQAGHVDQGEPTYF